MSVAFDLEETKCFLCGDLCYVILRLREYDDDAFVRGEPASADHVKTIWAGEVLLGPCACNPYRIPHRDKVKRVNDLRRLVEMVNDMMLRVMPCHGQPGHSGGTTKMRQTHS